MILQQGCRVFEVFPVCSILKLSLPAVKYYDGHLLRSWDWGEFGYRKLPTTVKNLISSEAANKADTYTHWAPLCLFWQLINANVIQNTTRTERKGWDSVLALLTEPQTSMFSGCAADTEISLPSPAASGAEETFLIPPIDDPPCGSECGSWKCVLKDRERSFPDT